MISSLLGKILDRFDYYNKPRWLRATILTALSLCVVLPVCLIIVTAAVLAICCIGMFLPSWLVILLVCLVFSWLMFYFMEE